MGTGLIFAAIAVAWLAYLVPLYLRRQQSDVDDPAAHEGFSTSARILATGAAPLVDQDGAEIDDVEVSTPMTRRAAIRRFALLERRAAARRRRVLVVLLAASTATVVVAVLGLLPWWCLAVPGGLLLAFLVTARVTVRAMVRRHDSLVAEIRAGSDEEDTVLIDVGARAPGPDPASEHPRRSAPEQLAARAPQAGTRPVDGLWEPIPVTTPTYVSKPLAPRTVRTIDLSAPDVTSSGRGSAPVLAETAPVLPAPAEPVEAAEETERRRASGE